MIRLNQITKHFGQVTALKTVDLTIDAGEIYGLTGLNGAGKTTLIQIVIGTLRASEGKVEVLRQDPFSAWKVRRQIGFVGDEEGYFPELTYQEFLWWVGRLRGGGDSEIEGQIERLSTLFKLQGRARDMIASLSHGMRRKVAIASAFMGRPKVIVLDEPTNGFDSDAVECLAGLLKEHASKGGSGLISCHDHSFLQAVCSHGVILDRGSVVANERVKDRGQFFTGSRNSNQ